MSVCVGGTSLLQGPVVCVGPLKAAGSLETAVDFCPQLRDRTTQSGGG